MNRSDCINDIKKAAAILQAGGIIVYPAETVYGIGCDPLNREACMKIQFLKNREEPKTMLLLAYSLKQVEEMAGSFSDISHKLAEKFWPGPLTLIIKPQIDLPEHLIGLSGGVAFRVTSHPVAAALARKFARPIISTSANTSGQPPVLTYNKAIEEFGDTVDMVIGSHHVASGKPSTVVDCTSGFLSMVREGSISKSQLKEALQ